MLRRFVIPLLLVALGAAGLMALARSKPQPQPLEVQEKVWPVAVSAVAKRTLSPTLTLYARVDSPRSATLTAAVTADVTDVSALDGQRVEKGVVLVRLDDRDALLEARMREAEVAEIESEQAREDINHANDQRALALERELLALIRRDVKRAQELARRDMGSASQLDAARQSEARQLLSVDERRRRIAEHATRSTALDARASRARSMLAMAKLDVERTHIRAPFSGPVAEVFVAPGDRVRAGDRLLSMYDDHRLEFRAQVPTRYLSALRRGLASADPVVARARVDGVAISAKLDRLGADVQRGRGGSDAFFRLASEAEVKPELGRTVELVVPLPSVAAVIALPAEGLYGTDRVYAVIDDRLRGHRVERVGEQVDEQGERRVLVRAPDLDDGTPLVITQLPNAVDGLKVRVTQSR